MSNVNNYKFAEMLQVFESKVIIPQKKKISEAEAIMIDPKRQWKDDALKAAAGKQLDIYHIWLKFYEAFYAEGLLLCTQHETLTDHLSKWYDSWYGNISNDGKQESELMPSQADILSGIFAEIYQELKPLNLDIKPPAALNMK